MEASTNCRHQNEQRELYEIQESSSKTRSLEEESSEIKTNLNKTNSKCIEPAEIQ